MNDHCSLPNFLAYKNTSRAFARHSWSLSLVLQEMSLNIDINRILPVKFSGLSNILNSKVLTSPLSCNVSNPGADVQLEFRRLSIDSVKVSVALRSCDPSYPFPCCVRFRIRMDLPKPIQNLNPRRLSCVAD